MRADLINSEMSGVAFSSVNQCFRQPDLKRMFETSPPITCPHAPDVLVCVDPCAGGEHSVRPFEHAVLLACMRARTPGQRGRGALGAHSQTPCLACLYACPHAPDARKPGTCCVLGVLS